jgi:YaiO family outer membrane protein
MQKIRASVEGEHLSYTDDRGSRHIVNAETLADLGKTTVSVGLAKGWRKTDDARFKSTRVSASLAHDWSRRLSTRTSISLASNSPVFATRDMRQDVTFKLMPETAINLGARRARYFDGVKALSWSAGATQYFAGGFVSYRFTSYDIQNVGHSTAHLVSARLKDPYGSTQLWAGHGTALREVEWLTTPAKGRFSTVELRRVQNIGGGVGLVAGVNRGWYRTGAGSFNANGVRFGLAFEQ